MSRRALPPYAMNERDRERKEYLLLLLDKEFSCVEAFRLAAWPISSGFVYKKNIQTYNR